LTKVFSRYILLFMMKMNMRFKRRTHTSYTLLRIVGKIVELHKRTRDYGTGERLFDAEIHMIKAIKENEGIHVTGLAELLGVTKGAVSQIVRKLKKKGMITKDVDPRNLSRLVLCLTAEGETAYEQHEKLHRQFDEIVDSLLDKATDENKSFLKSFLDALEAQVDAYSQRELS